MQSFSFPCDYVCRNWITTKNYARPDFANLSVFCSTLLDYAGYIFMSISKLSFADHYLNHILLGSTVSLQVTFQISFFAPEATPRIFLICLNIPRIDKFNPILTSLKFRGWFFKSNGCDYVVLNCLDMVYWRDVSKFLSSLHRNIGQSGGSKQHYRRKKVKETTVWCKFCMCWTLNLYNNGFELMLQSNVVATFSERISFCLYAIKIFLRQGQGL